MVDFWLIFDQNNPLSSSLEILQMQYTIINLMLHAALRRFIENAVSEFEN